MQLDIAGPTEKTLDACIQSPTIGGGRTARSFEFLQMLPVFLPKKEFTRMRKRPTALFKLALTPEQLSQVVEQGKKTTALRFDPRQSSLADVFTRDVT
jgi:hypothetical protein